MFIYSVCFLHVHVHMYLFVLVLKSPIRGVVNIKIIIYLLFIIYNHEYKTKENKIWSKNKIESQHTHACVY